MLSFSWVISMKYFLVIVIFGLQFGGGMQMTFLCFGNMMNKSLGNSQKFLIPVVTPSSLLLLIVTNYSREKIGFLDVEVIKKGNQLVTAQPACTVLWASPYGHISVETYWTIIGQKQDIQVFNFGSAVSGMHLASRNMEKYFPKNLFYGRPRGRPKDVTLQVQLWNVFRRILGRFSKTKRI